MNRLNDNKYRQALKSVQDPFDKMDLWEEIDQKLTDKEKTVFPFWWLGSLGIILLIGLIGLLYFSGGNVLDPAAQLLNDPITLSPSLMEVPQEVTTNSILKENETTSPTDKKVGEIESEIKSKHKVKTENKTIAVHSLNTRNQKNNSKVKSTFIPSARQEGKSLVPASTLNASAKEEKENKRVNRTTISIPSTLPEMNFYGFTDPTIPLAFSNSKGLIIKPLQKPRLTFGLEVTGGTNNRRVKALNGDSQAYVASRQSKERGIYRTGINVELAYKIKPNWEVLTSLQWQRLVERFNAEEMEINTTEVPSDSATYAVEGGVVTYFPGMINRSVISTRQVQQYNHTHKIGVSLGLRFQTQLGPIPVYAQGRILYHPSFKTNGKMINSDLAIVNYLSNDGLGIGEESRLETQLGLGLSWPMFNGMDLITGIQWQQDLSLFNQNTDVRILDSGLGLVIGVRGFMLRK